jgi:hypothetical protein
MLNAVPQTLNYMLAGYAVLIGLPALYVASWFWRRHRYEQNLAVLSERQTRAEPAESPSE